jgi:hypothetical protein
MSRISRFATTVAVSGGLALAGLGLGAGTRTGRPVQRPNMELVSGSSIAG